MDEVGFYDRQNFHHGHFMDRADVERLLGRVSHVIDLVAGLPHMTTRQMASAEACVACRTKGPLLFVDGFRYESVNFLSALRPEDVYAIEVYRTPSQIPSQFGGAESGCVRSCFGHNGAGGTERGGPR